MQQWWDPGRWVPYDGPCIPRRGWRIRLTYAHDPKMALYGYLVANGKSFDGYFDVPMPGQIKHVTVRFARGVSMRAAQDILVRSAREQLRHVVERTER